MNLSVRTISLSDLPGMDKQLSLVWHIRSRGALLCRVHAAYSLKAERSFVDWMSGHGDHEAHYQSYIRWSSKAAHAHARHAVLLGRVLRVAR